MASGYTKHTGRLGVCVGTTGPGAIYLLNGLDLLDRTAIGLLRGDEIARRFVEIVAALLA